MVYMAVLKRRSTSLKRRLASRPDKDHWAMKHVLMGVAKNEDVASFQQEIEISLSDLTWVMGWGEDEDCLYDYRLTAQQILALEK